MATRHSKIKIILTHDQINIATKYVIAVIFHRSFHEKDISIFNKECPDNMLANNRTLRLTTLEPYEMTSTKSKKGDKIRGVP